LVSIVQPTVQQKNQTFNIYMHDIQHEMLRFDSLRLNQVLLNLLSNALKFTPNGGSITVEVTESSSEREGCARYTFRVADTGIGIKPEFMEQLFTSFTREKDSRVNKIEGSGLGMAITKMIVDLMEGSIHVESEPGKGTVFTVELDLTLADEDAGISPLPALRVLVADDDKATCRSADEFLTELGLHADTVQSGRAAVDKAVKAYREGAAYDLILLDWKMPDMDGVEAVRAIRKELGPQTPLLIFSAYDWSCIETEAFEAGVTGFIQKPIFKSTLYTCIKQYVLHEDPLAVTSAGKTILAEKNILLAEDNELNQEISRELLESLGAHMDIAGDGAACVERFKASEVGHFDLILMDIHMPVMNGYEATVKIRSLKRPDAATVPIFALTADAFAEDIKMAKECGMNSHLAKPLDIPGMLRETKKYLS
ncbi:MAG: response regulator, partial [Oscillospiraceae bacterium]|nr:response regulator [Oscillospiraceae bacterium]